MTWTPSPPALVRCFERAVRGLVGARRRAMFGYPAVFVNGNMFAGLVRDRMILRLGEKERARFLALRGTGPFIAMKGRVMNQWVVVPPAMLKAGATLRAWLRASLRYGRSLPPKQAARGRVMARGEPRRRRRLT